MCTTVLGFVVILLTALANPHQASAVDKQMDGFWFGQELYGQPVNGVRRAVLLVRGDKLFVLNPQGVYESQLQCNPNARLPEMDILRYDGKEQYGVEKGELRFTLANPGDKRPTGETVKQARGTSHSH